LKSVSPRSLSDDNHCVLANGLQGNPYEKLIRQSDGKCFYPVKSKPTVRSYQLGGGGESVTVQIREESWRNFLHGGIDWSRYAKGYLRRISKVSCTAIRVTQICLHRRTWKCLMGATTSLFYSFCAIRNEYID